MNRNRKNCSRKSQIKTYTMRTASIALCAVLTANMTAVAYAADTTETTNTTAAADTTGQMDYQKDENVYVSLNQDGSVSEIYVVNEITSEKAGTITDHGDYSSVKNLTTDTEIIQSGDEITVEVPEGKFYYQGNVKTTDMPWNITITYFLDGEEICAEDLAGKSGSLEIQISIRENEDCDGDFFDNYLLQATVLLDTEKCSDITADGATEGNVGKDRQLLYNIMAGQEKDISITAEVEEFEMEGISFQGVPMSFDIDADSIDTSELTDKTSEITDAVAELDDGAQELKDGTEEAYDGGAELKSGVDRLLDGMVSLKNGTGTLVSGSNSLAAGAVSLESGILQYTAGTASLGTGVEQYVSGVDQLAAGAEQLSALENLGTVNTALTQLYSAVTQGNALTDTKSLTEGSAELTAGLKSLKENVDVLAQSADMEQLTELAQALSGAQTLADTLAATSTVMSETLSADASAAQEIASAQESTVSSLNEQVDAANAEIAQSGEQLAAQVNSQVSSANQSISSSVAEVNGHIDTAIAAIEGSGMTEEEKAAAIDALNAARLEEGSLTVSEVTVPTVSVSSITMPEENARITENATLLAQSAETLSQAAAGFQTAPAQLEMLTEALAETAGSEGTDVTEIVTQLQSAVTSAYEGAAALENGITQVGSGLEQLTAVTADFQTAADGIQALNAGFDTLQSNNEALLSGVSQLNASSSSLVSGASAVTAGNTQLSQGLAEADSGTSSLLDGGYTLQEGTVTLTDGLESLDEGVGELKDGTAEFREETADIDDQIDDAIDEMLDKIAGNDYEAVSFVSSENTRIGLVQFAAQTDGITIEEEEIEEEDVTEDNFWDKIKGLFE